MTVYSRIYCVGSQTNESECYVKLQIFVGEGEQLRYDVNYLDRTVTQLGGIRSLLPERRDDPQSLLDACIAFYPQHFRDCPSLRCVEKMMRRVRELDLCAKPTPPEWRRLRTEAMEAFKSLRIYEAPIRELASDQLLEASPFSLRTAVRAAAGWLRGAHHTPQHPNRRTPSDGPMLPKPPTSPDPHTRRSA